MIAITLTDECTDLLNSWKEQDTKFNFSRWIQGQMLEDETMLTKEQLEIKIRTAELNAEKELAKAEHLRNVIPLIIKKLEQTADDKDLRSKESVATLKRILKSKGEERYTEILPIHANMCGLTISELDNKVKLGEPEEVEIIEDIKLEEKPKVFKIDYSLLNEEEGDKFLDTGEYPEDYADRVKHKELEKE